MTADHPASPTDWASLAGDDVASHPLYPLFYPKSVAVVGASPKGGYGLRVVHALQSYGFEGPIYPINPNYQKIAGLPAFPEIGATPGPVDAVAIAVPSRAVPGVVQQAIAAGVRGGTAFGSGFAEAGEDGISLQLHLRELCGDHFPLVGPNCLGVLSYLGKSPLWSIPTGRHHRNGTVGIVAQSGNMALNLMATTRGLTPAYVVSAGNQAVVDAVDVMSFYLADPQVRAIAAVIEGITNVTKFRRVAERAAERDVPIVVLKIGRSEKGSRAAIAHTGSLTGSDQLYDALFRQYGVIRVDDLEELAETAKLLGGERRPSGLGLGVFASSGGECGLLSDLATANGLDLPDLLPETRAALIDALPQFANPYNPLDMTAAGWGDHDMIREVALLMAGTPGVDIAAMIGDTTRASGPLSATGWDKMISGLAEARTLTDIPIAIINTMTDTADEMTDGVQEQGLIHLVGAANAVKAIAHAGRYAIWQREHPAVLAQATINPARQARARTLLPPSGSGGVSETISKELLRLYGIPVPAGRIAGTAEEAVDIAGDVGYPVVLKVEAEGVFHKTEIGGVITGINTESQLRSAFTHMLDRVQARLPAGSLKGIRIERMVTGLIELLVGGRNDSVFGPVVVAGLGGILVEALQDTATRLAPVDATDGKAMLNSLRTAAILGRYRGREPVDLDAAGELIAAASQLLIELPEVRELDLNPVLAGPDGCTAVDALVVV